MPSNACQMLHQGLPRLSRGMRGRCCTFGSDLCFASLCGALMHRRHRYALGHLDQGPNTPVLVGGQREEVRFHHRPRHLLLCLHRPGRSGLRPRQVESMLKCVRGLSALAGLLTALNITAYALRTNQCPGLREVRFKPTSKPKKCRSHQMLLKSWSCRSPPFPHVLARLRTHSSLHQLSSSQLLRVIRDFLLKQLIKRSWGNWSRSRLTGGAAAPSAR